MGLLGISFFVGLLAVAALIGFWLQRKDKVRRDEAAHHRADTDVPPYRGTTPVR